MNTLRNIFLAVLFFVVFLLLAKLELGIAKEYVNKDRVNCTCK